MLQMLRSITLALYLVAISTTISAAELSIREWSNDLEAFRNDVFTPLSEQFSSQQCIDDMGQYIVPFLDKLPEIQVKIASKSYLLLRESIVSTAQELGRFEKQINCSVLDRWQIIKHHIERKIQFLGNLFAITEDMDMSIREWVNDLEALKIEVLQPLNERFSNQPCSEDIGQYVAAYLDYVPTVQANINPKSYLLFREIGTVSAEQLVQFKDQLTCAVVDHWTLFKHYLERKTQFLGDVFAILE